MPVFLALQTALSLWMLYDAARRGAPQYWLLIILVPFGECIYFLAVKLPDLRFGAELRRRLFTRRVSLRQLRVEYGQAPSHANRLRLAQALHDRGEFAEAAELFREVLAADDRDKDALYGYARCALEAGDSAPGLAALERLVETDATYLEYEACSELAELYAAADRTDDAIALLERVCKRTQRVGPRALLARYLARQGRLPEARAALEEGLHAYETSPAFSRRRDRAAARRARALRRELR